MKRSETRRILSGGEVVTLAAGIFYQHNQDYCGDQGEDRRSDECDRITE